MLRRRLLAMAVLAACMPFVLSVGNLALAGVVLAPAIVALVVGPQLAIERGVEATIGFAALVVGVLAPRLFPFDVDPTNEFLSERARLLACPVLVLVAVRALMVAPAYGVRGTLALALVGVTAGGRAKIGPPYVACVVAFLLLAAIALAANDPQRAMPERRRGSHALRVVGALLVGGALAGAVAFGIPRLHTAIMDRIMRGSHDRSGFSTEMALGAMRDMLMSDQVVLRIRERAPDGEVKALPTASDPSPDYLRGAVFTSYWGNAWHANRDEPIEYVQGAEIPEPGTSNVELEFVSKPERYFLPLDASRVVASNGNYVENRLGIRWPATSKFAKRIWYQREPNERLAGSTRDDLSVPFALRGTLDALLAEWGIDLKAPAGDRLEQIRAALQARYAYSLEYTRTPGVDAIVDFLTVHKEGHCEYFAGALALLARRAGVAARVVAGYRVSERSPIDDYMIVRQRDAHSWVEGWNGAVWVTADATPAGVMEARRRETGLAGAVFDFVRTSWERFDDFLAARSPFELTLALVALVGLLVLIRLLRARRARGSAPTAPTDAPLPAFEALERALAAAGLRRAPSETLDAFAGRIEHATVAGPDPRGRLDTVAEAIRAYAAHRYGSVDSEGETVARLEGAASFLRGSASAAR